MNLSASPRDTPGACVGFDAGMATASSTPLGPSYCDEVASVRDFRAPSSYDSGLNSDSLTLYLFLSLARPVYGPLGEHTLRNMGRRMLYVALNISRVKDDEKLILVFNRRMQLMYSALSEREVGKHLEKPGRIGYVPEPLLVVIFEHRVNIAMAFFVVLVVLVNRSRSSCNSPQCSLVTRDHILSLLHIEVDREEVYGTHVPHELLRDCTLPKVPYLTYHTLPRYRSLIYEFTSLIYKYGLSETCCLPKVGLPLALSSTSAIVTVFHLGSRPRKSRFH